MLIGWREGGEVCAKVSSNLIGWGGTTFSSFPLQGEFRTRLDSSVGIASIHLFSFGFVLWVRLWWGQKGKLRLLLGEFQVLGFTESGGSGRLHTSFATV